MDTIRRLEKLSLVELSSLVLKLELRGFKEVMNRPCEELPAKHFFRQKLELSQEDGEGADFWLIVWSEPIFE